MEINNKRWMTLLFLAVIWVPSISTTTSTNTMINNNDRFNVEVVSKENFNLGEGPHWRNRTLYFVDAFVGDLHCFDFDDQDKIKEQWKINLGDLTTIIIPVENGNGEITLATIRNKLVKVDWNTKKHEVIDVVAEELGGKERFNDGKIDAYGRLWIGTVLHDDKGGVVPGGGALYKLVEKKLVKMSGNFSLSNGMAWSKNKKIMYFNDSEGQKVYKFDFDIEKGTLSNKQVWIDVAKDTKQFKEGEYPDGMAIDKDDHVWIALWGGGRIIRIDPTNAKVVESISLPSPLTTSLTFGGTKHDQLYVTTASFDYTEQQKALYPEAGKVFRVSAKEGKGFKLSGPKAFEAKL